MGEVLSFTEAKVEHYSEEFLHVLKMQGKSAAGRRLRDVPEMYKTEVIKRIKKTMKSRGKE